MGFYSDVTVWSKKGVPKLTSLRLLSLLKNAIWSSKKGHPHKLPNSNIKAVMVLTNVWCSSIFYVSVSAANTWWHPNHTSKEELVLVNLVRGFSRSQDLHWKRATCGGHLSSFYPKPSFALETRSSINIAIFPERHWKVQVQILLQTFLSPKF